MVVHSIFLVLSGGISCLSSAQRYYLRETSGKVPTRTYPFYIQHLGMAIVLTLLLCSIVPYLLWNCQSLYANYREARKSGYPLLICPANPNNVLWMIFSVPSRPVLARFLPAFIYRQIIPSIYGWEFPFKYELFARLGSSFILVTPGKNELWVADPETAHSILLRRNDFVQSDVGSRIIGMFGPNVITVCLLRYHELYVSVHEGLTISG